MLKSLYGYLTNSTKTTESPQIWHTFRWICSFSVCLTVLLSSSSVNDLSQTLISILMKRCNAFNPKKIRHRVTAWPVETVGSVTPRRNTSLYPHSATVRPENCSWVFVFYCWNSSNQQAWPSLFYCLLGNWCQFGPRLYDQTCSGWVPVVQLNEEGDEDSDLVAKLERQRLLESLYLLLSCIFSSSFEVAFAVVHTVKLERHLEEMYISDIYCFVKGVQKWFFSPDSNYGDTYFEALHKNNIWRNCMLSIWRFAVLADTPPAPAPPALKRPQSSPLLHTPSKPVW